MKKKSTLKRELIRMMLLASMTTLLTVVVAFCYIFFSFFFENALQDIEYVISSTVSKYQSYMQFVEDGEISIRRNIMLDDFFEDRKYDEQVVTDQLSYCMNLYSERNVVDRQLPFVTSVYLFNNEGHYVSSSYYATTIAQKQQEQRLFIDMYENFGEELFASSTDEDSVYFQLRIYDNQMQAKGVYIVQISKEAIEAVLSEITSYKDSFYLVVSGNEQSLVSGGQETALSSLQESEDAQERSDTIDEWQMIASINDSSYGTRVMLAVSRSNIFAILQPTLFILAVELLVVFAVTFLIAYGASYRFVRPVNKMRATIQDFSEQNLEARVEDSDIKEFVDIGHTFNKMADNIEHLITDVYEKQLLATQFQVKYLQAQINPHFQFNILSMLSLKAKLAGNEEVYEGLRAFSRMTSGKIFRDGEVKIKVREELEIVGFYLYLQKSRYQEKLSYDIHLQSNEINDYLIPRLLIEPLVENAVSHGLEPKRGSGSVRIELSERDDRLCIMVEDDGVGMDEEMPASDSSHTHTSIENTRRMLQILYDDNYDMAISSKKNVGTRVEISIPIQKSMA